jgi:hypothetical protein
MKKGLISFISGIVGAVVGAGTISKIMGRSLANKKNMSDKHLALFLMMNQWVKVKQEDKNISEYFEENNIKRIAIYGMSYVGERLIEELKVSNIEVAYGIDREAKALNMDVEVVTLDDDLKEVDAVVVTAITFFEEIAEKLEKKLECPIISLEDILFEI